MTMNQVRLALDLAVTHTVTVGVTSSVAMRQYNEDDLSFGFLSRPQCVVCREKLANQTKTCLRVRHSFKGQI
jgi:hypothetical protein